MHNEIRYEDYAIPKIKTNITYSNNQDEFRVHTILPGEEFPEDLKKLRQDVYVEEMKFANEPFYTNDANCSHMMLYKNNEIVGSIAVAAAEDTDFNQWAGVCEEKLKHTVFGTRAIVAKKFRSQGYYKALLYICFSRYRRQGRERMVAFSEETSNASRHVMDMVRIENSKNRDVGGYDVGCYESDINYICYRALERAPEQIKNFLLRTEAVDDLEYYTKLRVKKFYSGSFYKKVVDGTLSKQAYIESLAHTHCYVRWTTRILAQQLVSLNQTKFFKEIAKHLNEEIGHPEMIIENLESCGASGNYIDYVKNGMVANRYVDTFMSTQEAAVSWRRDPIAFMGVPVAIEAITAFMPTEFRDGLVKCSNSWGLVNPKKATSFWLSHLEFDNPHNGHWARTIGILRDVLTSETQVIQIRNYIDTVISNISAGYDETVNRVLS